MTGNGLFNATRAEPFRAFRVHMGGGRALDAPHREFMSISPNGRIAVVYDHEGSPEIIDIFMIQSLQMLPFRVSGQGGRGRGRKAG